MNMEPVINNITAEISEEDGCFIARFPQIGTVSQGRTKEEALKNLLEATELYLQEFPPVSL